MLTVNIVHCLHKILDSYKVIKYDFIMQLVRDRITHILIMQFFY